MWVSVALAQLLVGSAIQPGEYVSQLGLSLPAWLLLGLLFVAVHGLVLPRFLANLACLLLLVLGFTDFAPGLGLEHPLWRLLSTPLSEPDQYWGFDGSLAGHATYLWFWLPACLAVLLLAIAWHHRTLLFRQVSLRQAARNPVAMLALPLVGLAVWQGSAIDRVLRQEGLLVSNEERARQRADYERRYAGWAERPQPDMERISAQVDFHSRDKRVKLRARIRLINRTSAPITEILIGRNQLGRSAAVALSGGSILQRDVELGQTVYRLDRPLVPGGTINLDFATNLAQSGIEPASFPFVLRSTFSRLPVHAILPVIGFKRELTLRDPDTRREQGLPELILTPPSRLPSAPAGSLLRGLAELEATISTDTDLHAIAQGDLVRRWQAGERNYFHYRTNGPVRNHPVFYAVPWKPQTWPVGEVQVKTYSPRPLADNDLNVLAMRDTLAWLGREVTPYPGNTFSLVAIPDTGPGGFANPQIIEISHRLGFRAHPQTGAGFSQVYRRAAHETAHQWFGHILGHGIPGENAFLVESLAKYAELVMVERRYGKSAMLALVRFERDRYRQARLDPDQQVAPLIDAESSEDMYSRATLVFACARAKLGGRPIIDALQLMAVQSQTDLSPARSIDFVSALTGSAPAELQRPIEALFLAQTPLDVQLTRLGCKAG